MRGKRPSRFDGWMRARASTRIVARMCLVALVLNLFTPIAWAALADQAGSAAVPSCHEMMPDQSTPTAPRSGDAQGLIPHCPLCVLFAGSAWAPPMDTPVIVAAADRGTATAPPVARLCVVLRPTLRPSPRAPPPSI